MKKRILSVLLAAALLFLCACSDKGEQEGDGDATTEITETKVSATANDIAEMFSKRDLDTDYSDEKSCEIILSDGATAADSDAVTISGDRITVTDEGTYIIKGALSDGMIVVDAKEDSKVRLVLDGASVRSEECAPLYVSEADKVVLTLAEGSENTLENGGAFESIDDNNIDGTVFSKADLTLNGGGSLTVVSPAGHGIVCKDDLVLAGSSLTVNCASHAIEANDSVRIREAALTLLAGKDGIHAENSDDATLGFVYIQSADISCAAEGDGISAAAYMQIEDGTFKLTTGGGWENGEQPTSDNPGGFMGGMGGPGGGRRGGFGAVGETATEEDSESIKGLKASGCLTVNGGAFEINSADDAIHSNASVYINGGEYILHSGDDGIHADEELRITEATVDIKESYEGLEGLDIRVLGGKISLSATDDGLNAAGGNDQSGFGGNRGDTFGRGPMGGMGGMGSAGNGSIVISGGEIYIEASGDGIDANGTLEITGGYTVVGGPTQGDTATLDYDVSAVISGGTFIGTGGAGMAQTFSDSEQGVIAVSVGNQSGGEEITVADKDGNVIVNASPALPFAVVIISSPELEKGEDYTLSIGSLSDTVTAG